jgi:hypothetical protein
MTLLREFMKNKKVSYFIVENNDFAVFLVNLELKQTISEANIVFSSI